VSLVKAVMIFFLFKHGARFAYFRVRIHLKVFEKKYYWCKWRYYS